MPSPRILDLEMLCAPIAGENPAGQDVRYDGTHDAIKEARRADDALARGEWVREIKTANWAAVIEIATKALATKSKDLQVACWLTEGLLMRHGFPGLRDGLQLTRELQERYWDELYPAIEEGDVETRVAPLAWLNEKLPVAVREVPVTQSVSGEHYSWLHWEESRQVDNLGRQDQEAMATAIADGKISGEQFDKTVESTPLTYYQTLVEDLGQLFQEYEQLDRVVDVKFGRQAPPLRDLKEALEDCRLLVADIVKKKGGLAPQLAPAAPEPEAERAVLGTSQSRGGERPSREHQGHPERPAYTDQPTVVSMMPHDRADALRRLAAVAEYFRSAEPHSPVAYLVQRAVRWGEMPFDEWLRDVIHDESVLGHLRETLGLKEADGDT